MRNSWGEFSLCLCQWGQVHHANGSDHKRAYVMAIRVLTLRCLCASSSLATEVKLTAVDTIVVIVLEGMIKEGRPYPVSFTRLIPTADGPKVIEFNRSFWDPEQIIWLAWHLTLHKTSLTFDGKEPVITWRTRVWDMVSQTATHSLMRRVSLPAKTDGHIITYYAGAKLQSDKTSSQTADVSIFVTIVRHRQDVQNIIYNELNKQKTEGLFYRTGIGSTK